MPTKKKHEKKQILGLEDKCYVRMEDTQQNFCIFMKIKIKFKIFFSFFQENIFYVKKKTKMFALKWHIQK